MHYVMRPALALALVTIIPLRAVPASQSEYKQADSSYYLRSDLFLANPAAMIAAPEVTTNMGSTYLINTRGKAPAVVYLQETHDWIEPITPPNEPADLDISPADMEVREPLGSVQVALPSAPADFRNVEAGQVIPNGAVLRTGDSGSVAVLFGGVDSVRLAPNSQAAVQMNFASGTRDVEIGIRSGIAFSKVGSRSGEKQAYKVHTPFGDATAHGTDYVTVVYPARVDVWVAQGTVELSGSDVPPQVTASTGHEPLKVMRSPAARDARTALAESAESLTALLNFIPVANQKLRALTSRTQSGAHLTAKEKDYVGRIRKVVSLIKLANVNAPAAPVDEAPAPLVVTSLPPTAKPALRALPVEPQPSLADRPMVKTAPRALSMDPQPSLASRSPSKAVPQPLPTDPQPSLVSRPASNVAPRALPVEQQSVTTTEPVAAVPLVKAAYKTKPVVITLPPAHFPKVAPKAASSSTVAGDPPKAAPLQTAAVKVTPVTKAEVAKASPVLPTEKTKTAATTKPAHATKAQSPLVATTKPAAEKHYLRAKPVDPADLAAVPVVRNIPPAPPARAHAEVDPNSLGAPLNPMQPIYPAAQPQPTEADSRKSVTASVQPPTDYSVP